MTRRQVGTAVFAVAFVVLGLPDFAHGVAWPEMRGDLDRPLADLGVFLAASSLGYLAIATSTGRLAARWDLEGLVLRSTLSSAAGLALVAVAPSWPFVLLGGALAGTGAGGMDSGFNAAVALRGDARLMGLLHAGYGVGAAIGPVVVGVALVGGAGWRPSYALFALAGLVLVVPLLRGDLGDAPPQGPMGSPAGVVLPCLAFFVYVALEVTVGQWAFTALTDDGVGELAASIWVGAYWVGLTAGRLWLGTIGHVRGVDALLAGSAAAAIGAALLLWLGGPIAALGLPLMGLALSVVFPLLMLLTPEHVGAERATAAVGWQAAAASLGAAAGPAATGVVLGAVGIGAYGPASLALAAAMAGMLAVLRRGSLGAVRARSAG